jgi:hypothetical protein
MTLDKEAIKLFAWLQWSSKNAPDELNKYLNGVFDRKIAEYAEYRASNYRFKERKELFGSP